MSTPRSAVTDCAYGSTRRPDRAFALESRSSRCPSLSFFVCRYCRLRPLGAISSGTRRDDLEAVAVEARRACAGCSSAVPCGATPRSARICAPTPYSRRSSANPSCRFASTVSLPVVLQRVGLQLVEQADAAAFLAHVEEHARRRAPRWLRAPPPSVRRSRSAASGRRRRSGTRSARAPGPVVAGIERALDEREVHRLVHGGGVGDQPERPGPRRQVDLDLAVDQASRAGGGRR